MSELALKLIRENIEKHKRGEDATFLDLGNCGMTEVPEEIGECVWLDGVILRENSELVDLLPLANLTALNWLNCSHTNISNLSQITNLINLQILACAETGVSDLSPLAVLVNLQELYIFNTQISDLSPLSNLKNLNSLFFSYTQVSDLSPIRPLVNLLEIDCSNTKVCDLSPIRPLVNLLEIDCSSTQISDLSPLVDLKNLKILRCGATEVVDIRPLSQLTDLKDLDLQNTSITDISSLSCLENLERLTLFGCKNIDDLSPVASLRKLKSISLGYRNKITSLAPLSNLENLEVLSYMTGPVEDISPLANLKKLKYLEMTGSKKLSDITALGKIFELEDLLLTGCGIEDLTPIGNLDKLSRVEISGTNVRDLLPLANRIRNGLDVKWKESEYYIDEYGEPNFQPGIYVKSCPLITPPVEFARESPQAVRDYFEELGDDGRKLNEVKVIFLGEASAGKTSLVKRLLNEEFDSKESQTHGIRIRKAPFQMNDDDTVTAHLWDFGGQEVMHATHQFFLSQRCIYVLLLNSRNDDQAEKWLKHAASFGGNSPVLVVLNKIDENPSFDVNRKALTEKYPQIRDFFRLSAKTDKGIDEFREALRREIDAAPTRRTPFPAHWLEVKEHFSNMKADYIESTEYRQVCERLGVTRRFSQDVLLQFLHDLGVVINFRNLKNFDTQILNPLWLTNGVYRIVNSELVANAGGIVREADFDAVINDPRYKQGNTTDRVFEYPKNKLQYIVRVMEEFELCFALDARTYVVPQLLPVQEPEFKTEGALLRFVIHFPDFMPDSLFPRLMVKLHTFISGNQRWRTGMVLHKPSVFQALARVRWDKEDQKILIDVCGDDRRRLLSFIRETVKEIVGDFTNLAYGELVPIPDSKEYLEYKGLVAAEKAKEQEIFVWQVNKKLRVADLLNGVEDAFMRDKEEQLPVKAFVSYSHKDLEHLKELRSALAPLVRLQKLQLWDDRDIDAGDEWEKVIFQQLEEADIVICLVSADFVASDFCYKKEFSAALDAHQKGEKTIVPVMLRKTNWQDLPIAKIQGAPGEWITSATNKDEAWTKVSESLQTATEKAKQHRRWVKESRYHTI